MQRPLLRAELLFANSYVDLLGLPNSTGHNVRTNIHYSMNSTETANPRALALGAVVILASAGSAWAAISATAVVTTSQTAAPYNYTVTLQNTGTTPIGTFWFAWTPPPHEYNFLPHVPTAISGPAG